MKIFRKFILILFLLILLIYVTNITAIPNSILLFKGEELNLGQIFGIYIEENREYNTVQTSSILNDIEKVEKSTIKLKLFNTISVKEIEVNTIPETTVIPVGNIVGLELYASGVLVVGKTEIEGQKPYINSGIEEGDMIIKINERKITSTEDLVACVNSSQGKSLEIVYVRERRRNNSKYGTC